jgi:hypothetical protein
MDANKKNDSKGFFLCHLIIEVWEEDMFEIFHYLKNIRNGRSKL